jgi:hypothetical protein
MLLVLVLEVGMSRHIIILREMHHFLHELPVAARTMQDLRGIQ